MDIQNESGPLKAPLKEAHHFPSYFMQCCQPWDSEQPPQKRVVKQSSSFVGRFKGRDTTMWKTALLYFT